MIVLEIAYRCVFLQGERGTNLPKNTLDIVSIKCVYRDKCGFAAAETNNRHYYCCFSLCVYAYGELGVGSKGEIRKTLYKDCQSSNFLRSNQSCRSHKNGGLGGEFIVLSLLFVAEP